MIISLLAAWAATVCAALTAFRFISKKNKKLNRIFHRIHIPLGVGLIIAGLIHGLLAGNSADATLKDASIGETFFSINTGTVCFILAVALGVTYLLRRILKKKWMTFHRILTVALILSIVIHIAEMGITLPRVLFSEKEETQLYTEVETTDDTANDTTQHPTTVDDTTIAFPDESNTADSETEAEVITDEDRSVTTEEYSVDITEQQTVISSVTFSGATLTDGTFEGQGQGYKGNITVSVTVNNGMVTAIDILSESDTPKFFDRAKAIIDRIIGNQSLEVDAVSGATFSSRGIKTAVYNALEKAVVSGKLSVS